MDTLGERLRLLVMRVSSSQDVIRHFEWDGVLTLCCKVTHAVFETGSEELKDLELKVFVASGRFIIEGEKTIVEYKLSEVVKG